jgi:phosphatidylglycerophosphate synthase
MSPAPPSKQPLRLHANVPNLLSLSRIPLGGLFWAALALGPGQAYYPFGVLAAAAVTDVLDGYIARRRHGSNPPGEGAWLDPLCDKAFVALVLVALYFQRHVPLRLMAMVMAREIVQLPIAVFYRASPTLRSWLHYDFRASAFGKAATMAQFLVVCALILNHPSAQPLAVLAFGLGLVAVADYIRRAITLGRRRKRMEERGS